MDFETQKNAVMTKLNEVMQNVIQAHDPYRLLHILKNLDTIFANHYSDALEMVCELEMEDLEDEQTVIKI